MLIFKSVSCFILLPLLFLGIAVTADNVDLGIEKDFEFQPTNVQSYSGWVKWNNEADLQSLTDSQLLNFAKLAYDRMVVIFKSTQLSTSDCPGAMTVLILGQDMFFGSSMKTGYQAFYNSQNSVVGKYLRNCQRLGDMTHRTRLGCGEPNVIDVAMRTRPGQTDFSAGRLAVWGTYTIQGQEECLNPCSTDNKGYGCMTLISQFKITKWAHKTTIPDGTDGTQWASYFAKENTYARDCPAPNP